MKQFLLLVILKASYKRFFYRDEHSLNKRSINTVYRKDGGDTNIYQIEYFAAWNALIFCWVNLF